MSAADSIRTALQLLACASNDWRCKASDGTQPLHWTLAVGAAKAHLQHALTTLESPATGEPRTATPDDVRGMEWFNALTEAERREWLQRADSAVPADAWRAYKAAKEVPARQYARVE
jgi:hypothetical protein